MTREDAETVLTEAGQAGDAGFPLLEAAIACAIHDYPFRDPEPVRVLARNAAERLAERIGGESPDEALAETMAADLRLNGDLLSYDHPGNTDVIDVAERRRGLSAALSVFYLDAARRAGVKAPSAPPCAGPCSIPTTTAPGWTWPRRARSRGRWPARWRPCRARAPSTIRPRRSGNCRWIVFGCS